MGTPHNEAKKGDFAKTVLMPGDPLRSKFIAETFLTDLKLVNNGRGVQGYTGLYKGVPVSVMASGMGMPSIGIYSYELYTQYDVENIIRVGSAGALRADLELGSVVAGQGACANSAYLEQYELGGTFAPIADFDLLMAAVESAKELGVKMPVLTWTDQLMPIKQSAPVMLTLFGGMGYTILLFAGFLLLPGWRLGFAGYAACFAAANLLLCAVLHRWLRKKGAALFAAL